MYLHNIYIQVSVPPGCSASCASVTTNLVPTCGPPVVEGRVLTNVVYFLLRMLATMALACVFIILDAQTIQVIITDGSLKNLRFLMTFHVCLPSVNACLS